MGAGARRRLGAAVERGPQVTVSIDGRRVSAHLGETVAALLLVEGRVAVRRTAGGSPRGVFCGMGTCFDCLIVVDGVPNTRACMTWVRDGLEVRSQDGLEAA